MRVPISSAWHLGEEKIKENFERSRSSLESLDATGGRRSLSVHATNQTSLREGKMKIFGPQAGEADHTTRLPNRINSIHRLSHRASCMAQDG